MRMLTLQFVREAKLTSSTIAWFTQGEFSHVDAVRPEGLLGSYESVVGNIPAGVQLRPAGYRKWARCVQFSLPLDEKQELLLENFYEHQKGKPYDWGAIWGFVAGRDWRAQDSWICSELQAAALENALVVPPLECGANKISPNALALLMSSQKGVQRKDLV